MSLVVHVSTDGVRPPLSVARIGELARGVLRAERVRDALVSIALVTPRAIAALNRAHLGHAGATDVLSFGFARAHPAAPVVGDIYIAPDIARANARQHGVGVREELARLVIHGTLHVLGYEHPEDAAREQSAMWLRQEMLMRRLLQRRVGTRRAPGVLA